MPDLLPCPFCGEAHDLEVDNADTNRSTWVICHGCGACGAIMLSHEQALRQWNTRAALAAADAVRCSRCGRYEDHSRECPNGDPRCPQKSNAAAQERVYASREGSKELPDTPIAAAPMPSLPEPVAYIREWDGDESDLGQWVIVGEKDECDDIAPWWPVVTLDQARDYARAYAEQETAALRADAERLDWLERNPRDGSMRFADGSFKAVKSWAIAAHESVSLRDAIDAAMAAEKDQQK